VERQARDRVNLDPRESSQKKADSGDDKHRQEIGHENREEELRRTRHVKTGSYDGCAVRERTAPGETLP
jgi:hypothetical protein